MTCYSANCAELSCSRSAAKALSILTENTKKYRSEIELTDKSFAAIHARGDNSLQDTQKLTSQLSLKIFVPEPNQPRKDPPARKSWGGVWDLPSPSSTMDFKDISDHFGGTIFPEEYRGDFKKSEKRIEDLENELSPQSDAEEHARALLLRAVLSMFTGDPSAAKACLEKLRSMAKRLDSNWIARSETYMFRNFSLQRVPPVIRFRPELNSAMAPLRDAELESMGKLKEMIALRQRLGSQGRLQGLDRIESDVIIKTYTFNSHLQLWSFSFHPQYPPNPMRQFSAMSQTIEPYPEELPAAISAAEMPLTALYFQRLTFENHLGQGSPKAPVALESLINQYEALNDKVGIAMCKTIQADSIISPPFSSPIAFNLIPTDKGAGWVNEDWDAVEPQFKLGDNSKAQLLYGEALNILQDAEAPRAQAAIRLRQGCIQHAEAINSIRNGQVVDGEQLFAEADEHFRSARQFFDHDQANTQIVNCHQTLLDISRGRYEKMLDEASAIGRWGFSTQNTAVSNFVGLLFLRFARRQYMDYSQVDVARRCCACATACFSASQDHTLELQALTTEADLHYSSGNTYMAQLKIDAAHDCLEAALDYVDRVINLGGETQGTAKLVRSNMLAQFDRVIYRIYSGDRRKGILDEWRGELSRLRVSGGLATSAYDGISASIPSAMRALQSRPSGPESVTSATTLTQILQIHDSAIEKVRRLNEEYYQCIEHSENALHTFDTEAAKEFIQDFINRCDKFYTDVEQRTRSRLKLLAFYSLGDTVAVQSSLSEALPLAISGLQEISLEESLSLGTTGERLQPHSLSALQSDTRSTDTDAASGIDMTSDDAELAIAQCYMAQDWRRAMQVLLAVRRTLPNFLTFDAMALENTYAWQVMIWVGCIYEFNYRYKEAFKLYLRALQTVESRRSQLADIDSRVGSLSTTHTGELFMGLARISLKFAKLGDFANEVGQPCDWQLRAASWTEQALAFLEQGRARTLLDLMIAEEEVDGGVLKKWASTNYISRLVRELKGLPENDTKLELVSKLKQEFRDEYKGELKEDLKRIENELERQSLTVASMLPLTQYLPDVSDLFTCIPPDAVVIEVTMGRQGLVLVCITRQGVEASQHRAITDLQMRGLVMRFLKGMCDPDNLEPRDKAMDIARTISDQIVRPVAHLVRDKKHIIFVPSHSLHAFPFSALLLDDKPLFLQKAVSEVPSLSTLHYLVRKKQQHSQSLRVSVVANPAANIRVSGIEAITIARLFGKTPENAMDLTTGSFNDLLQESHVLHVGTHGVTSDASPWHAYILLREKFRVLDLAKMKSSATLVVFAACLSGLGKATVGNDLLGFSNAILQSGALVYVGGLWEVNDLTSMLQMIFFYQNLAERRAGVSIAECWQHAQITLYGLDNEKVTATLTAIIEIWDQAEKEGLDPSQFVADGRQVLQYLIEDLEMEDIDFKHPYVWAPFVMIGHAGFCL